MTNKVEIALKQSLITDIEGCIAGNIPTNGGRLALTDAWLYTTNQLVTILKDVRRAAEFAVRAKRVRAKYSDEVLADPVSQKTDRKLAQSIRDLENAKAIIGRLGIREVHDAPVLA